MIPARLQAADLRRGAAELCDRDPRLAELYRRNGLPPLWGRPEGFASLVKVILEQQVSLASAAAAFGRLEAAIGDVAPEGFLTLDDDALLAIGFSRQKTGYCRGLAAGLLDGSIVLDDLSGLPDDAVRARLLEIRGVGPWTAEVYLMFSLGRPDIWPPGDRALLVALGSLLDVESVPASDHGVEIAHGWAPWRSVAARLLWHDYLGGRSGPG